MVTALATHTHTGGSGGPAHTKQGPGRERGGREGRREVVGRKGGKEVEKERDQVAT